MILKIRNLKKEYLRGKKPLLAVDNLSLDIEAGAFVCLFGRSGSGKSTFLNMVAGLLAPTSGKILFDNQEITGLTEAELAWLRNTRIGFIPQGQSLLPNLTVFDNVRLPAYLGVTGRARNISLEQEGVEEKAFRLLERMGILELAGQYPSQLSGGELRRAAIARALVKSPRLVIADEPTGDLDRDTSKEVMLLFSHIARGGTTVLVATHQQDMADYGTKLLALEKGRLYDCPERNQI